MRKQRVKVDVLKQVQWNTGVYVPSIVRPLTSTVDCCAKMLL